MGSHSLSRYVVAVAVVWALLLAANWFFGSPERFRTIALVGAGFALGMIAMYIATGIYGR